jgi:hypothetical protein
MKKALMRWPACAVLALGSMASHPSFAQSTPDCSTITEDRARLKCYDEQSARQKKRAAESAAAATSATPGTPTTSAPAAAASPSTPPIASPAEFGLDGRAARKKETPLDQIVGRLTLVEAVKPRGQYRFTLEDGQVWEATETPRTGEVPQVGETVTFKRGMLGSYFLSRTAGTALRVKRVK